ncbi:cell number regulator 10-like [Pyrus ussuriensis x Pyrus communis]|uniref:Cell number regulator 10-like n=1 Tax=Pyrus ussuriensis x Pyrus communis TaxID=2448454 RepID=A0A5N5F9X0_9ROSA|nr:cell number regulator 10-like [Pyrus ussuriensis x Pyrus communis]
MNLLNRMGLKSEWSSGIFGCGNECSTCCITYFCPCVTFGRIAEIVDEGKSCCTYCGLMLFGLQWLYSCFYRQKLRAKYNLPDKPCCDCGVHFFCDSCALCQEHAELKERGLDPAKGKLGIQPANAPPKMRQFLLFDQLIKPN